MVKELPPETVLSKTRFKCSECLKSYTTPAGLRLHVQNIHLKMKRFNCNFCEYSNFYQSNFHRHVTIHLDLAEETTARNKREQTEPKMEEFVVCLTCQFCSKDCKTITSLKHHIMKKHDAWRRLTCDYCGWGSLRKCDLQNHLTCKHVIKSIRDMYDQQRRFKCTFEGCQKRFKIGKLLRQHMNVTHSGKKSKLLGSRLITTIFLFKESVTHAGGAKSHIADRLC